MKYPFPEKIVTRIVIMCMRPLFMSSWGVGGGGVGGGPTKVLNNDR